MFWSNIAKFKQFKAMRYFEYGVLLFSRILQGVPYQLKIVSGNESATHSQHEKRTGSRTDRPKSLSPTFSESGLQYLIQWWLCFSSG